MCYSLNQFLNCHPFENSQEMTRSQKSNHKQNSLQVFTLFSFVRKKKNKLTNTF